MNWIEVTECPICHKPRYHMLLTFKENYIEDDDKLFYYWLCACGNAYLGEKPEDVDAFYDKYEDVIVQRCMEAGQDPQEGSFRRSERVAKQLGQYEFDSLLDVGAAYGFLLNHFGTKGMKVRGYDIRDMSTLEVYQELPTEKYDMVTCIHTLEHVYDPVEFLNSLKLVVGKYLFIEVPSLGHDYGPRTAHPILFSMWGLTYLFHKVGFKKFTIVQAESETGRIIQAVVEVEDEVAEETTEQSEG